MGRRPVNPFVFGRPVSGANFIGREEIIDNCFNRLAGPVRTSIAISGELGFGKTSLLFQIIHLAQKDEWGQPYTENLFVYLNCQTIQPFTPTHFWQRVLQLLKENSEQLELHRQIDNVLENNEELDATHLQRLLRWMGRQSLSLVLLLDGFTAVVKSDRSEWPLISAFLAGLRALINLPDNALTLVTTSRVPLNVLCADIIQDYPGSHFYNNFAFEFVLPFSPAEVEALFAQALAGIDFEFDQADQALIQKIAGTHPALLQMASYQLFQSHHRALLTDKTFKEIITGFERTARPYFSNLWAKALPLEQSMLVLTILHNLAKQSQVQDRLNEMELLHLLQRHERNLMGLLDRGLIQQREPGYEIFSVVFTWWIVREVANETEATLADRYRDLDDEKLREAWQILKALAPDLTLDRVTQMLIERPELPPSSPTSTLATIESSPQTETPKALPDPPDEPLIISSRYEIIDLIGRGAYGVVYKAKDQDLGRYVALKRLDNSASLSSEENRQQILKEAQAVSKLDHPYIVTVFDVTSIGDYIWMVMEYIKGKTLAAWITEEQQLPLKQVIAIVEQAAQALDHAHSNHVIHRDIKPANLIIKDDGQLRLTDFGIAKIIGDAHAPQSTGLKGTVLYMSPEQINVMALDGRSDLFSLATITYEMLSGTSPWTGKSPYELMTSITNDQPRSLKEYEVPAADQLDHILLKALAKDPAARYQSGEDFVRALKTVS